MGVVPFQDGKLSSKAMFDKEELKKIQEDLPKYMNEHGFELERSELNSEAKHKTVAEFKQEIAYKGNRTRTCFGFWSARVCQQSRRICDKEEYQRGL